MVAPLICIIGKNGSGKTTLSNFLLKNIPSSRFLTYITTRKPRSLKERLCSHEYKFVSEKTYFAMKNSKHWDEFQASGCYYGVDLDNIESQRKSGITFISNMLPQRSSLEQRIQVYRPPLLYVYLEVPEKLLSKRNINLARRQRFCDSYESIKDLISLKITQTDNLQEDLQVALSQINLLL